MDALHRKILQTNRSYMVEQIEDVEGIVDGLCDAEILTEPMRQDIMQGEKTTIRRVRKLLDILPKRGPFAFDIFCSILIKNRHRHVAVHLNPTLANLGTTPVTTSSQGSGSQQPAEYHQQSSENPQAASRGESDPGQPRPKSYPQPKPVNIHSLPQQHPVPGPSKPSSVSTGKQGEKKPPYGRQSSREVTASQPQEIIEVFHFPAGAFVDQDETAQNVPFDLGSIPPEWPQGLDMAPFNSKDFDVDSCTQDDVDRIRIRRQDIYRMFSTHHGRAVIINNQEFSGDGSKFAKRNSSDMDSNRLQLVLKKLAFNVQILRDLNKDEMVQKLQLFRQTDHDEDAFILVILSYGGDGTIFCEDGKELKVQEIINIYSNEKCNTLKDKPKMIFIQACGTKLRDTQQRPPESEIDHEEVITRGLAKLTLGPIVGDVVDTNPGANAEALPLDTGDMVVAMATCPDVENGSYGSVFVLALAYVFCHCSKNQDLESMLHRMNQLQKDRNSGRFIKLCEVRSSLKKKLYFLPGYPLKGSDPETDFSMAPDLPTPSFGSTKMA